MIYLYFFILITFSNLFSAYVEWEKVLKQPNGEEVMIYLSGDEFWSSAYDKYGYLVIDNKYAIYNPFSTNSYQSDIYVSNDIDSRYLRFINKSSDIHYIRHRNISHSFAFHHKKDIPIYFEIIERFYPERLYKNETNLGDFKCVKPITQGVISSTVIFLAFKNIKIDNNYYSGEFDDEELIKIKEHFNRKTGYSVRNNFRLISNNNIDFNFNFYPKDINRIKYKKNIVIDSTDVELTIKDGFIEIDVKEYEDDSNFFQPGFYYDKDSSYSLGSFDSKMRREQQLLNEVIKLIKDEIRPSTDSDINDDGVLDNVTFVINFDGSNQNLANPILWPHHDRFDKFYTRESIELDKKKNY